jgi:hypothetical protein
MPLKDRPIEVRKDERIAVPASVVRFVDAAIPGFVECELIDVHGRRWMFVEKGPVVTAEWLTADSRYPQPGLIACKVVERTPEFVRVDTSQPWGMESIEGETRFDIAVKALTPWPS